MSNLFIKKKWNDNDWSIFINNLNILRISYNIKKKKDLSKKIGVGNIYRKNYNHPGELTVIKIYKLFNVTEEWLSEYQTKLPPEDLQDAPGSTFGPESIVIQGHEFQNKEIIMDCVDLLWNIEQIDPDIFAHAQTYLEDLLDYAGVVLKKINRQSSG